LPWLVLALLGGFISVKVLGLFEGMEIILSPLLLQWQEMSGAIISNYCARFGKQHLEWVLI
jgi:hypothetical protein